MGEDRLLKLVRSRHKVLLRVMVVFALLLSAVNLGQSIQNYHNEQKYVMDLAQFEESKQEAKKNHLTFYNNKSYEEYREDQRHLFIPNQKGQLLSDLISGRFFTVVSYLIPLIVGLAIASIDQASGFNAAIFSSGFRRRRVFATRYWYGFLILLGAMMLGSGITIIGYYVAIPAMYVGLSGMNLLGVLLMNIAVVSFMYTIGTAIGTIFASPFWMGVFGLFGTWFGATAADRLIYSTMRSNPVRLSGNNLFFAYFIAAMVISIIGYFATRWLFDHISLENAGNVLLLPKLRWVVMIYALAVIPYGLGQWLLNNELLSYTVSIIAILALGFWWWYRERPQKKLA